ncbi:MAG: VWA domain-containing protein [Deltaproteobacteria bacterium]|nr:VWA domain-containing protein [Deltaproteobacteria bacterium]
MSSPYRIRRSLIALSVLALATAASPVSAGPKKTRVEVVFVLDTTGSMGGLIQGAKQKIWSIVNEIAKGKPTPEIRLGLIGYRDKGDDYVCTRTDLTADLDGVYEKLMAFDANGGGDGPEHVNQALWEAVHKMSWSADRKTLKIVFLVGDAPPHMDYQDDVKYPQTCQEAVKRDLVIHTIQCGAYQAATSFFQDIARKSEGRYMAIAQSGGTVAIATPYDARLAELSGKLDATYVGYGSAGERSKAESKMKRARVMAAEAAPEAAAARASYKASTGAVGSSDLLSDVESGKVELSEMKSEALPEPMQKMSAAERRAFLEKKKAERESIRKQIGELSRQRDAYVKKEMAEKSGAGDSFDAKVIESIRDKAAKKGIRY